MAIRMSGMISGLDTESIVKSLMETQQAKKTKIESKKQKLEWKQEIWSGLNTKMYSFIKIMPVSFVFSLIIRRRKQHLPIQRK